MIKEICFHRGTAVVIHVSQVSLPLEFQHSKTPLKEMTSERTPYDEGEACFGVAG
jgi:hypothetical protein